MGTKVTPDTPGFGPIEVTLHKPTEAFSRPNPNYKKAAAAKEITKFLDPCEDARKESMKCLDEHMYDRQACMAFFQNMRDCKDAVRAERGGLWG